MMPLRVHAHSPHRGALALCALGVVVGAAAGPAPAQEPRLDLERAVDLAITRNERVRTASALSEAAQARLDRARAFFFPDLNLSGTYTRRAFETVRNVGGQNATISSRNAFQGSAALALTVFDARSIPLYRQASRERRASFLKAEEASRGVAFEAADAFLRTLGTEQVLAAAERRLDFARRSLQDAQARFDAGLVSSNDVTRVRLELATAERELSGARATQQTAYLQLANLLDAPVAGLEEPLALLDRAAISPPDSATLLERARRQRLDVVASREHARAQHAFAQEPMLRYIPSFGFTGLSRLTNEGGLSGRNSDWSLALNMSWSLYDGGERGAERAERLALARVADLETRALERQVDLEVESARVALENAQVAIRSANVAVEAARQNAEETAELYRQGLARALEVADANVRLFEADVALARERFGLGLAFLDLRSTLGLDPLDREPKP